MTGADAEMNGPYAITIVHVFDAPRELVFRNWIAAADLATWFAPDNCTVTFCEVDARPGGKWRVEYHCDFGSDYIEHGEFHEVVEPERLVFSLTQEDRDGRVGHRTLVTLSFARAGAQTEMTFTQTGFETPRRRDNNTEGWNECFAMLTAHIREATMNHDEAEIRALIERWATAVHTGDLDVVLADHTEDIVMFDVPPPNEVRGKAAYRDTWPPFFEWQERGAAFEIVSLEVAAGEDVAFAHALLRCGTVEELEKDPGNRLRLTVGLRKMDGRWAVAHEHHSFPLQSSK